MKQSPRVDFLKRLCGVGLGVGLAIGLAACSLPLPQAQTDPTRYFVLAVSGAPAAAQAPANAPALRLRPIELPAYLQDRPIVVRRGENEIEFQEFSRWGEPLDQGIARVLRQDLLNQGAASTVQIGSLRPSEVVEVKYDLTVRILACEGLANGGVNFHAAWQLTAAGINPTVVARGDYHASGEHWTPRNNATLASALSASVAGLASDIAAQVPKP